MRPPATQCISVLLNGWARCPGIMRDEVVVAAPWVITPADIRL
jgi:hypothetical protein